MDLALGLHTEVLTALFSCDRRGHAVCLSWLLKAAPNSREHCRFKLISLFDVAADRVLRQFVVHVVGREADAVLVDEVATDRA